MKFLNCVSGSFLMEMLEGKRIGHPLPDLLHTDREELVAKVAIKGSLGSHDKMFEFQFQRKASGRIRTSEEWALGCLGNC